MPWLVFVDTNILLDFYRLPGASAKRQLQALERHKGSLITSEQVRMEFLKNRQKVMVASIKEIKKPSKQSLPQFVAEYQPAKMMVKNQDNAGKKFGEVKAKIEKMLRDPSRQDHVYQSLNRIFDNNSPFNLRRPNKERFTVRNLARKRFIMGYPPRKPDDTSIGDAINWEWIVRCAINSDNNHDILIVSRDADFGVIYNDEPILNDWLRREFKDRVSRRRKIELTNRLTVAMRRLDEHVAPQDVTEENRILEEYASTQHAVLNLVKNWDYESQRRFYQVYSGLPQAGDIPAPADNGGDVEPEADDNQ